jgi:hypothetical protein
MGYQVRLLAAAFFLALLPLSAALHPQEEGKKTEDNVAKKSEDSAPKKTEEKAKDKPSAITVHVLVTADKLKELPDGSSVEIKPDSDKCNAMTSVESDIHSGKATFADIPVCKVRLLIFVTGFNAQGISVDLSKCKEPITVKIDLGSPPKLSCSET